MNYYNARQVDPALDVPDAGKWRYTCMNDGRVWAVGPCATGCDGHDTAEEACEHYRQGLLDDIDFDGRMVDQMLRCVAPVLVESTIETADRPATCGEFTDNITSIGPGKMITFTLCERHRTRETVDALYPSVGMSFGSY